MKRFSIALMLSAGGAFCAAAPAVAQDAGDPGIEDDQTASDLFDVPLEDLLTLETTSVAKKRQQVRDAAAAVYVITQEDIRRSAASTIPDLLRMVPGVEVGQVNTGGTAVSIRGFNSRLANSVLVMIDGRSIYVSTLSGVFWDQLLLPLGDIERIEVVRGPGSTLWGSNAANGVINIITKHSSDSLGLTAVARAGTRGQEASLSYGSRVSDDLSLRVYGALRSDDGLVDAQDNDQSTHLEGKSVGARIDWQPGTGDAFTFQTEYSVGHSDTPFLRVRNDLFNPGYDQELVDNEYDSFNALGRWTRHQSDSLDWSLQAQHNRIERTELGDTNLTWDMTDLDFGLHWQASEIHDFNFGVGVRLVNDRFESSPELTYTIPSATDHWISGYVQDDISLIPDRLRLTLGVKLEDNNFTGFEFQPSAKLFFRPDPGFAIWGGVSRAVVTPSRLARSAQLAVSVSLPNTPLNPGPLPLYAQLNGVEDSDAEVVIAYEAGFRADLSSSWTLDVASYYNEYDGLTAASLQSITPLFSPGIPFPLGLLANFSLPSSGQTKTWGVEAVLKGEIKPWWKMELSYSHFDYDVAIDPASGREYQFIYPINGSPHHQARLHNSFDLADRLSVDVDLRHVSSLTDGVVPAYTNADFRITYHTLGELELSLIGENLLKDRRAEFTQPEYPIPLAYVPRKISIEIRHRF